MPPQRLVWTYVSESGLEPQHSELNTSSMAWVVPRIVSRADRPWVIADRDR